MLTQPNGASSGKLDGGRQRPRWPVGVMHHPAGGLADAAAAAAACGVTRLADVTGLDRIGVPVFQAIRPLSRALAVHQGKGLAVWTAQMSALMEAVESAHAEAFETTPLVAAYASLPREERAASPSDFARLRGAPVGEDEPIAWAAAERVLDGRMLRVPVDCVSLDCVRPWDPRLEHTSNGLGARLDAEGAVLKGLLEVLERDAAGAWLRLPGALRSARQIDAASIPYPWFLELAGRLARAGVFLSLFDIPTLVGLPAAHAELFDPAAPSASASAGGWGCAADREAALQAAVLEALQARLTLISGARDDILFGDGDLRLGDACPLPPGMDSLDWARLPEGPAAITSREVAERLAAAGYPDAAFVRLSRPEDRVRVVKVFAPGLGTFRRTRRPAAQRALQ